MRRDPFLRILYQLARDISMSFTDFIKLPEHEILSWIALREIEIGEQQEHLRKSRGFKPNKEVRI